MNDDEFNALVDRIQAEAMDEARRSLGEKGFERWQNPKFCGPMENPDGYAKVRGECGDTMQMFLRTDGERVVDASYLTDGCGSSAVAASFAAELAIGKDYTAILDMTGDDVLNHLGAFPKEDEHCPRLAVKTLQEALNQYLIREAEQRREKQS